MLKRVLIANRGEIARRIARTCRRLGIEYVAVYSEADRFAAHLDGAVEHVEIGGAAAADSYLNIEAVVEAALRTDCDAVHPGYGFLSENPRLAAAVAQAGLVFVGPGAETIAAMGDKARARTLMAQAGVPVLPGSSQATDSLAVLAQDAERIGYPVILKPVAGGGGKGMAVVAAADALPGAVEQAVRIGRSAFGDGRLLVERYVARPRHIEVQVFGDGHGKVVHLHERECSLQRRHQKIIEEAPAVGLAAGVREALLAAAVRGAEAIGYVNAGTFEFILDGEDFFFLEVNTRLQVEHPVTEEVTGVDLVEWQLRVAGGEPLPVDQEQITVTGHAIECRVYAEDPEAGFRPAPGSAAAVRWPGGVRVEAAFDDTPAGGLSGARGAAAVPAFYDPLIAKLVAHGTTRAAALRQLTGAIAQTTVAGLTTNLGFLAGLLAEPEVLAGRLDTHLVDDLVAGSAHRGCTRLAVACAAAMDVPVPDSPWTGSIGAFGRADLDPDAPLGRIVVHSDDREWHARLTGASADVARVTVDGQTLRVRTRARGHLFHGTVDDIPWTGLRTADGYDITVGGYRKTLTVPSFAEGGARGSDGAVRIDMPGTVVAVARAAGDPVHAGDVLVVVESMKLENRVLAPFAGVPDIRCAVGDVVAAGQILAIMKTPPAEGAK
ncbi:Carbamoyl-phosphate synthase L chain ATP- binding [Catenulispora acidiphila DSM 44928]|uniref:biotin carboxylase n=1 Tax=Catenulispora acidiphila (strain DSM 44928 / JCM 14897 / NBRC 102108 / NRRL B-24433 / ID139908) TaxID=479433 RepID=C7QD69_CATAD|nr:biotin carboxylase N-terminal domain-containing protein [Catenulispora acidiphila]ACU72662.1 Carbamoyl-phosphate synthase L chain ATP- binding [Catenulispora acidiphila DSM 44928]